MTIYTCTLNPSIDYVVQTDHVQLGSVNMASFTDKQPGGKGINVSRMLHTFDVSNTSLGFVGGFTGDFVLASLDKEGIKHEFLRVEEDTRINIKLKGKEETEINGVSPFISSQKWSDLLHQLEQLQKGDFLVLSGSVPSSLPNDAYSIIAERLKGKGVHLFADAKGEVLRSIIKQAPFLVKPNHHELGELFNVNIDSIEKAIVYGQKIIAEGVKHVIVSMAEKGAILLHGKDVFHATVPTGTVINSVGAGDSLVGGFLAVYSQTSDVEKSFAYGVASGSATAFSLGLGTKEKIDSLVPNVNVKKL